VHILDTDLDTVHVLDTVLVLVLVLGTVHVLSADSIVATALFAPTLPCLSTRCIRGRGRGPKSL
jgi:hypothetical protein